MVPLFTTNPLLPMADPVSVPAATPVVATPAASTTTSGSSFITSFEQKLTADLAVAKADLAKLEAETFSFKVVVIVAAIALAVGAIVGHIL